MIIDDENFAAFELRGAVLALFAAGKLAADGRAMVEPRQGGIRFTIGIMVDSRNEVDQLAERVRQSGGRSAYFADPEDNYWEIAWASGDNAIVAAAHRAARVDLSM